jgi:hypothetical protein
MRLPWTKREIIDAVIAEFTPVDQGDMQSWAVFSCVRALSRIALGRPGGRAAPHVEYALSLRIARVWTALHDGRDPNAAYEIPLDGEKPFTTDVQLESSYRKMQELLDETDRKLRAAPRGHQ